MLFQASRLLHDGSLTATDLTKACLKRIQNTTQFNAFIRVTEEEALKQADESNNRYLEKQRLSELDGIPIAIKDNFCTANINTSCAAKMLENFVPTYNATIYERLRKAGAILMGKTNLDQFAMGSGTVDSIYGPTKNIWGYNETSEDFHIAGGSSGGSAVAVATGSCFA